MSVPYRADIDGLRAVAVLAVVFFHAGFPLVTGGYVGVDIFFVISGFLITSILRREMDAGAFSITKFYERRVRRILPALLVVTLVTIIFSGFILLPSMNQTVPAQALAALGFVANVYFRRASHYFAPSADTLPFLHTWSLGVEEQFYIVMPLALLFVFRRQRHWQAAALILAAIASFMLSVVLTRTYPGFSFYLLPTRAWELLVGALLTYVPRTNIGRSWWSEGGAFGGLAAIAAAIFLFDSVTPFPGYAAALPVLGAALFIQSAPSTCAGALLSRPLMVGLGRISYSLYLWHWPIAVFTHSGRFSLHPTFASLLIVGLSLSLAFLSWRYIEQPFRSAARIPARLMLTSVGTGCLLVVVAGALLTASGGHFGAFDQRQVAIDRARSSISPWRDECHIYSGVGRPGGYCKVGDGSKGEMTVWSDSHGVELVAALAESGYKVTSITYSSCPPSRDYEVAGRPQCQRHNATLLNELTSGDKRTRVVMAAYMTGYPEGVVQGIIRAANELSRAGNDVILIGPMPTPNFDVPTHLAYGRDPVFSPATDDIYRQLKSLDPRVRLFNPNDLFCTDNVCSMLLDGMPILFDESHPTLIAARRIANALPVPRHD